MIFSKYLRVFFFHPHHWNIKVFIPGRLFWSAQHQLRLGCSKWCNIATSQQLSAIVRQRNRGIKYQSPHTQTHTQQSHRKPLCITRGENLRLTQSLSSQRFCKIPHPQLSIHKNRRGLWPVNSKPFEHLQYTHNCIYRLCLCAHPGLCCGDWLVRILIQGIRNSPPCPETHSTT